MKQTILLILGCALLTVIDLQAQQVKIEPDVATLRHLKEVLWPQAYREQDTSLLDQILAAEFQLIDDQGNVYNKADELAYIQQHKPSYDTFRFEITRLDIFENGTAIVSGIGHITGKDDLGAYVTTYRSSNVLIKRASLWKAVASHVSGINKQHVKS
ncbi:MAG: nuclear transport factor 2 family protein [Saprospiraceae bacterium]|nr:nuclear transport factor 2 family protein [Saprospiraceae bacterium]